METSDRRITLLRRLAWACVVMLLATTSLSAFIRLSRAGVGCEPWPQCQAQRAQMSAQELTGLDGPAVATALGVRRIAQSAVMLLLILLLVQSLGRQPAAWPQGRIVLALLGLGLFLAVLGRMVGGSRATPVVLGNLLAGFAMFALGWRLVQSMRQRPAAAPPRWLRPWAAVALVLVALQVALGGLVSAGVDGSRCGEAALCQIHRVGGLAAAALLLPLGALAWRSGHRAGVVVMVLVVAQAALGWLLQSQSLPLALVLVLAHNVLAALLLAALLALLPPS